MSTAFTSRAVHFQVNFISIVFIRLQNMYGILFIDVCTSGCRILVGVKIFLYTIGTVYIIMTMTPRSSQNLYAVLCIITIYFAIEKKNGNDRLIE